MTVGVLVVLADMLALAALIVVAVAAAVRSAAAAVRDVVADRALARVERERLRILGERGVPVR